MLAPLRTSPSDDYERPTMSEIRELQTKVLNEDQLEVENEIWGNAKSEIFIPDDDQKLTSRLLIQEYEGICAQRSRSVSYTHLTLPTILLV